MNGIAKDAMNPNSLAMMPPSESMPAILPLSIISASSRTAAA